MEFIIHIRYFWNMLITQKFINYQQITKKGIFVVYVQRYIFSLTNIIKL